MENNVQSQGVLFIERWFDATPHQLWSAWTDPALVVQWFGPQDWPAIDFHQDLIKGGRWCATLQSSSGEQLIAGGNYITIDQPKQLAFTFRWESDNHENGPGIDTQVNIWFEQQAHGTLMKFEQLGLTSREAVDGHTLGWNQTFDRFNDYLKGLTP